MANEIELTDPIKILTNTNLAIDQLKTAKVEMGSAAIKFSEKYEEYYFVAKRDGKLLKEKMKLAVIRGSNDHDTV